MWRRQWKARCSVHASYNTPFIGPVSVPVQLSDALRKSEVRSKARFFLVRIAALVRIAGVGVSSQESSDKCDICLLLRRPVRWHIRYKVSTSWRYSPTAQKTNKTYSERFTLFVCCTKCAANGNLRFHRLSLALVSDKKAHDRRYAFSHTTVLSTFMAYAFIPQLFNMRFFAWRCMVEITHALSVNNLHCT